MTFDRPYVLFGLIVLIPGLIFAIFNYGVIRRPRLVWRSIFRILAFSSIIIAYSGISFGTQSVPVQKSGNDLCFVFDISYSMTARDCSGNKSRLEMASSFAKEFLGRMKDVNVAVVLAKGDGISAVPLTEDYELIYSLLDNLSPAMMTSAGSNLGKGIETALKSFPQSSIKSSNIWLFTDCEETDDGLYSALRNASSCGVRTSVLGFGNVNETEILAGDKKTKVKTALRLSRIEGIVDSVNEKALEDKVFFYDSNKLGWAASLLKTVSDGSGDKKNKTVITYEIQRVPRYRFFIMLGILFYVLSIFISEWNIKFKGGKFIFVSSVLIASSLFTGCSSGFVSATKILKGTWNYYQGQYDDAAGSFLEVAENPSSSDRERQYAIFALAATYLAEDEDEAALDRFLEISVSDEKGIRYGVNYNCGIIAYRKGHFDKAREFFKSAIIADPEKINARINLELCKKAEIQKQSKEKESSLNPLVKSESESDMEKAIFSVIRENEGNQWKSSESSEKTSELDY